MKILILEGLYGNNKGKKCEWRLKRTNLKVGDRVVLNCHDWKIIKVMGEKKRFLSWDYGSGDYTNWSSGYVNGDGEIIIDRRDYKKVKEVKKVSRPYLETKIIKVKKDKDFKCEPKRYCGECWINKNCPIYKGTHKKISKPKGNWVNGENLDKIKFPCFCSYMYGDKKSYGEINECWDDMRLENKYTITDITKQTDGISVKYQYASFEDMIRNRHIHILKAKLILFEEE